MGPDGFGQLGKVGARMTSLCGLLEMAPANNGGPSFHGLCADCPKAPETSPVRLSLCCVPMLAAMELVQCRRWGARCHRGTRTINARRGYGLAKTTSSNRDPASALHGPPLSTTKWSQQADRWKNYNILTSAGTCRDRELQQLGIVASKTRHPWD